MRWFQRLHPHQSSKLARLRSRRSALRSAAVSAARPATTKTSSPLRSAVTLGTRCAAFRFRLRRTRGTGLSRGTLWRTRIRCCRCTDCWWSSSLSTSGAATTPATTSRALTLGRLRRALLLRRPHLRRTLGLLLLPAAQLRTLRTPVAALLPLLLLRSSIRPRRSRGAAVSPRILPARLLFELLQFLLHELADRTILPRAHFVESAVRTAPPSFGVGLPAGTAKNAFGQRHGQAGLYTSEHGRQ